LQGQRLFLLDLVPGEQFAEIGFAPDATEGISTNSTYVMRGIKREKVIHWPFVQKTIV
jgi:hypothetical protein